MSILGSNSTNTITPFFHEFKKQASFFLKEKIKTARLALTDVTATELLTEEVTNGNPWAPDTRTMGLISRAAFEIDDYWRIVEILHKRFQRFDIKNWRMPYNALILLEHLLTHGPESVADEFQNDKDAIRDMGSFQLIDEKGFNWGLTVRKKSERVLMLLSKGPILKEERDRARKVTRGIQGFGSFNHRSTPVQRILQESSSFGGAYGRCNSFINQTNDENENPENVELVYGNQSDDRILQKYETRTSFKENMAPNEVIERDVQELKCNGESKPLLDEEKKNHETVVSVEDDHPFCDNQNEPTASLLST
ncbi:ENTH domain [Dillenia turbinata]|uniref:ENTH domain n=1 Tax=Dillenia turbinata TaxID=194707 RepID=A0AAN8VIV2_9MAGN